MIDHSDEQLSEPIADLGIQPYVADIVMRSRADRQRLAEQVLGFAIERYRLGASVVRST